MSAVASHDVRAITAIVANGSGHGLLERLNRELGIHTALLHRARGVGVISIMRGLPFGAREEWDVLEVLIGRDRADEVFAWLFTEGGIDRPHGGFLYMGAPEQLLSSPPPSIPEPAMPG